MFKYFNPNPKFDGNKKKAWKRNDCVVRAICAATGLSWDAVFKMLYDVAFETKDIINSKEVYEKVLSDLGFEKKHYKYTKGCKRETVNEFCKNHNDTSIVQVANHLVCCYGGNFYDTWDCGKKTAYCYFEKM